MAERRMFAKTIIDSDAFLDMPLSAQALYFHLSMRADDDGFINNPKKIQRMIGCGDDDLRLLLVKKFILVFDNGVIVIKHWKLHNYIRNDRYKPTLYQEEKSQLTEDENKSYSLEVKQVVDPVTLDASAITEVGIPDGYHLDTQDRLGKDRLGKDNKDILSDNSDNAPKPPPLYQEIIDYLNQKANTKYRHSSKATKEKIKARLAEGFTIDDFKTVIDKKTCEWLSDANMQKYLRPETLFGTKFESYLNQQNWQPKQQQNFKPTVRVEQLPEWVDKQQQSEQLSAERQAQLKEQMRNLLSE